MRREAFEALLQGAREAGQLTALDVQFARALARWSRVDDDVRLPVALAGAAASAALGEQHICIDPGARPPPWWEGYDAGVLRECLAASDVVGEVSSALPLVFDDGRLYLQVMARSEWLVAERVLAMARSELEYSRPDPQLLQRLFPGVDGDGYNWQQVALAMAPGRRLTIVTGGPGTGKTTTVTALLAVLLQSTDADLVVRLAAPTGKAAARLTESVAEAKRHVRSGWGNPRTVDRLLAQIPDDATTLHRLLGYQPGSNTFARGARDPVAADVVVVDECSMLDLRMTARLLEALPEGARLILVGDRDQLASVDAGSVLADLCSGLDERLEAARFSPRRVAELEGLTGLDLSRLAGAGTPPLADCICWLTERHRFAEGTGVGEVALAVKSGDADAAMAAIAAAEDVVWAERLGEADLEGRLIEHYAALARAAASDPAAALDLLGRWQTLCAVRSGGEGVEALNRRIEASLRERLGLTGSGPFPGLPVMVLENDYSVGLFNGDVGVLVGQPGSLRAAFRGSDGAPRYEALGRLPHWEPVYAMTVHKSQGSEFDSVALVLPGAPSDNEALVLTRELIYTGLTRARRHVTLVASRSTLRRSIAQRTLRAAGLARRLWSA